MKKLFLLLLTLLTLPVAGLLIAQDSFQGAEASDPRKPVLIGKVLDAQSGEALEFATITLFDARDSSLVAGGVTEPSGNFSMEVRQGSFYAKVEFISYDPEYISGIVIGSDDKVVDLGVIRLAPAGFTLQGVEVTAEKSQMQLSLDKKVFNVGKDLATQGGTAADILDNVPSVAVDIDGNVSLRGSGVRILINGQPSGLVGLSDAGGLRQIPANLIDRVEVITNPSARYEAEGMTGIINIVLKKETRSGFNGSFDLNAGYPHNYGAAGNLNFRHKKFNLFANYGIRYRNAPGVGSVYQEFYRNDTTLILQQNRDSERGGLSNNIRLGSDFYINSRNTLTASFLYRTSNEDNRTDISYRDFLFNTDTRNLTGLTRRTDDEKADEYTLEYALNYKKTFEQKGRELIAQIRYEDNSEVENSDIRERFYTPEDELTGVPDLQQRSGNDERNRSWLFQADYVHPVGKEGKFETGVRSSLREIDNDFFVEEFDDAQWFTLPGLTNDFRYDEYIHAAYAILGNKYGRFSFQGGLRGEWSDIRTRLIQTQETNDRRYANLFPSAHVSYELPGQNSLQLSFSRRIRRPRFHELNPFFSFSDARNLFTGNPDLDPEFTNSYELGHIKYWEKGSLSSSIYYRHTEGVVERIQRLNEEGNTITRPENLSTEDAYGFEFTFSVDAMKWWKLNGDANFFYAETDGTNLGASFQNETFSMFGRITSQMELPRKINFQTRFNYRAPRNTTQGRNRSIYSIDLGLSKDILDTNGTLTLTVNDLLNSRKRRWITDTDTFYSEGEFQWRARQITLTLNYRLNQKKQNRNRQDRDFDQGGQEQW